MSYTVQVPTGKGAHGTSVVSDVKWPSGYFSRGDWCLSAQSSWCCIPRHSVNLRARWQHSRLSCIHGKFLVLNHSLKLFVTIHIRS